MDLKTAFNDFRRGGRIIAEERSVDLCLGCDGFGYVGHRMKPGSDPPEPDYNETITCPACGGRGYMDFITYVRDDGNVFYVPEKERPL